MYLTVIKHTRYNVTQCRVGSTMCMLDNAACAENSKPAGRHITAAGTGEGGRTVPSWSPPAQPNAVHMAQSVGDLSQSSEAWYSNEPSIVCS